MKQEASAVACRAGLGRLLAVVVAGVVGLVGCVSGLSNADRAWKDGRWPDAARGYQAALAEGTAGSGEDRALLRLGLILASPASPTHDAAQARARLEELVRRFPTSAYRGEAVVVLALLDQLAAAQVKADALSADVERAAEKLRAAASDTSVKDGTIARLRTQLADTKAELERVKDALEQLKRIDLRHRP